MVYACSTCHQTGDTDSFQLVIPLTVQLDSQGTFVPCEARIVWYSAGRTSSRQLRDTTQIPVDSFYATSGGRKMVISKKLQGINHHHATQRQRHEVYQTLRFTASNSYPYCYA